MIDVGLLVAFVVGISLLLILVLTVKIPAFISLLISSIVVGLMAGIAPLEILGTIQTGMGNTLGFVAVVVGLGAMFGAILESSGGTEALTNSLLQKFGEKKAPWALLTTGFIISIPVFFDVAFVILAPILYSLQRKTKKSLLFFALPLMVGLAVTHSFIPPTPGPIAAAQIIGANLGWVIVLGLLVGIPTAIISGPICTNYIAKKVFIEAPPMDPDVKSHVKELPTAGLILSIIGTPLLLIVLETMLSDLLVNAGGALKILGQTLELIGHPFVALILANLISWYLLGIKKGYSRDALLNIATKSMAPAGVIILLTGAGGVFKQMLIDTGIGNMIADYFAQTGMSVIFFAFVIAVFVRIAQGSATVSMITAAGLTAPLVSASTAEAEKALLVLAVAAGSVIASHVNDSGFWLISKYLYLDEKQTLKVWTTMTTAISLVGFICVYIVSLIF